MILDSIMVCLLPRWSCDDTVTHYIYQGRAGDSSREYRALKDRGVHVVSQHWLHAVRVRSGAWEVLVFRGFSFCYVSLFYGVSPSGQLLKDIAGCYPVLLLSSVRMSGSMSQSPCTHSHTTPR